MNTETLEISRRFRGPARSGNGGYVCGLLGKHVPGPCAVRLKVPPPLEVELRIEAADGEARLFHGSTLIGEARRIDFHLAPPTPPSFPDAEKASKFCVGLTRHSFPNCFVCGPQRLFADGMRIFPGPVEGSSMVAAPWVPDSSLVGESGSVGLEFLWAALDCPTGFSVLPVPDGKTILLGELCVRIAGAVSPGERCVAIAWPLEVDGRKRFAGSAIFGEFGRAVAVARATWIEVPASTFADDASN